MTTSARPAAPAIAPFARVSAWGAPLSLLAGCVFGALAQGPAFDSRVDTISALAALGANERWRMTVALVVLGACHATTALGLRPAYTLGRATLFIGGVATVLVACFPQPVSGGSEAHLVAAGIAFLCLALWPALSFWGRGSRALLPLPNVLASLALCALLGWFAYTLQSGVSVGLAERVCAFAEALWPLAVVLSRTRRRAT